MKMIFAMLLTTLFYSATTPDASGAANGFSQTSLTSLKILTGDQTYKDEVPLNPPSAGCVTEAGSLTPEVIEKIATAGGTVIKLEKADAYAVQLQLENLLGEKAPWTTDKVIFILASSESEGFNIGLFEDDCLKGFLVLPIATVKAIMNKVKESHI